MINFCVKSVHSLLGFAISKDNGTGTTVLDTPPRHCRTLPSPASAGGGLGFATSSGDIHGSANVVESSAVKSPPPSSPSATAVKKDPGRIWFLDEVGGSVDGLMSCTESLGFESSDERRVDDRIDNISPSRSTTATSAARSKWRRDAAAAKGEEKKFPPPLSSLNQNGKPVFVLWPVRKDGRLELKEVKIERFEVLRASREDGRLRLHLIQDSDVEDQVLEVEEKIEETIVEEEEEEREEDQEEEEEERIDGKWMFPMTNGGGDGFRRCQELSRRNHHDNHNYEHHHHHDVHAWSQRSVTIR